MRVYRINYNAFGTKLVIAQDMESAVKKFRKWYGEVTLTIKSVELVDRDDVIE